MISSLEAELVVTKWLHDNDFPDRYCAQDAYKNCHLNKYWIVPLWLTYPDRRGAFVCHMHVDEVTGGFINRPDPEEVKTLGRKAVRMMFPLKVREGIRSREVREVGKRDFIKINGKLEQIEWNTAADASTLPKHWAVKTDSGLYSMFEIQGYFKREDLDI